MAPAILLEPPVTSVGLHFGTPFGDLFDVFLGFWRLKKLPKYGRREQNALWRFGSYLLSLLSHNAKSMAGAILEGHL